ncbi:sigma factor-like helix-turn-helix DNA-binding protein [Clostridioides difficile]|uniref:sigma factor-like helix-turn-helix DNA-binding protein n=1 Tax=Clostridioides difficile TaxID=1496 RepID=UPI001033A4F6|nr:sigma factor-like helix-turn-helix DNA-binding protein [Clostridioides difficile]
MDKESRKEIVRELRKEEREDRKKGVLYNTRLLMKHYNDFKRHINLALSEAKEVNYLEEDLSDFEDEELYILSIKKSKTRTIIMIAHIDSALKTLKLRQERLQSYEKYRALELYYFDEKTYEEIAEILNCGVVTSRRWVNEMITELGIYLFGVDGLKSIV